MSAKYVLLSAFCLLGLAQTEDIICPTGLPDTSLMTVYHRRCIQFVSSEKYWDDARDYCWRYSGRLVKVDDPETNKFLVRKLKEMPQGRSDGVWIGLKNYGSDFSWQWVTDNPYMTENVYWTNWDAVYTRNLHLSEYENCVRAARSGNWQWHDTPCHSRFYKYRFVCEYGGSQQNWGIKVRITDSDGNTRLIEPSPVVVDYSSSGRRSSPATGQRQLQAPHGVVVNDMNYEHDNPLLAAGDAEMFTENQVKEVIDSDNYWTYILLGSVLCLFFLVIFCFILNVLVVRLCRARRRESVQTIDALSKKRVWRAMNTHGVDSVYDDRRHVVFPKAPWENEYILDESRVASKLGGAGTGASGSLLPCGEKSKALLLQQHVDVWSVDAENNTNILRESGTGLLLSAADDDNGGYGGEHIYESIDEVRRAIAALHNAAPEALASAGDVKA